MHGADDLPALLAGLPELAAVLPALREAAGGAPLWLVGGAVRDALLGLPGAGLDLDVVVEGDAPAVARRLGALLGGLPVVAHDAFGTATVEVDGRPLDVVGARRERYARPGALPDVEPSGIADDLARRDFTVNALAVALGADGFGRLLDPHGGLGDLAARTLRVLHPRSFHDDATRALRGVRYVARLGLAFDAPTAAAARAALADGALAAVGPDRLRDALLLLLREDAAAAALAALDDLGGLAPLGLGLDEPLVAALTAGAEAARAAGDAEPWRVRLGLLAGRAADPRTVVDGLRLARRDDVAVRAAARGADLARVLAADADPAAVVDLLEPLPVEAACAAAALDPAGTGGVAARRYLAELRHVRLDVTGDDLRRTLGLAEGPAVGALLRALRVRRLRGELPDRDAQLAAAAALQRGV